VVDAREGKGLPVLRLGVVASLMADGDITPDEASAVASVIETKRKAIETQELEQRVAALEAQKQK
jgi:hypothetical protein